MKVNYTVDKHVHVMVMFQTEHNVLEYTPFIPGKGRVNKTNLLNSHLLRNGAVGGEKDISQGKCRQLESLLQ